MDFLKLAESRYSVRKFDKKPVPREIIDTILKAGHLAPTARNQQPQRIFVISSPEGLEKLKECTRCHFDAPCAMLVCYNKDECWERKYDSAISGVVDASIVTTHMMLQAAELGIGTTWVMHFNPEKMIESFEIDEKTIPVALLVMGYPSEDSLPIEMHTTYRDMSEIVSYK